MRERDVGKAPWGEPGTRREGINMCSYSPEFVTVSPGLAGLWFPNDAAKCGRTGLGMTDWEREEKQAAGAPVCPEACLQNIGPTD